MSPRHADAERLGRVQRRRRDEHRRQADQRVERGDELRQRRHLDAPRDHGAHAAADRDGDEDQHVAAARHALLQQRRHDGDRHADHAEAVALPRGDRAGKPAQRQDEQDAGDEIGEER